MEISQPSIGIALGSGAARGWAHIGALRALAEAGIHPTVVCGSSIGAVVGAAYASGRLDVFESWVTALDWRQLAAYLDLSLRGGLLRARKVFDAMAGDLPDGAIESLDLPFAAVATDLASGNEVWFRSGPLHAALRASVALPGLVQPTKIDGRWLVDGGLVNPVPVSLCRALGADYVVAVDLNTALVGRRIGELSEETPARAPAVRNAPRGMRGAAAGSLRVVLQDFATDLRARIAGDDDGERDDAPSIYDVVANSINIMQARITRSRMAGEPADLLIAPRLADFGLLDFDRGQEAIEEGRRAVGRALSSQIDVPDAGINT